MHESELQFNGALYNPKTGACEFSVWAPLKKKLELLLGQNRRPYQMNMKEGGYWTVSIDGVVPGTNYMFRIDDEKVLPDPASCFQPEGVHGPSAVVDFSFPWTDDSWKGLPLKEMVIYELHVGTFTVSSSFKGVIEKLPYLRDLGINAVELMPLAQFPGSRNWGYDGVFPHAVQNSYGGPQGLMQLVDACHAHGIAVIVDVVYNHQGPEGNYLGEYAPYFTDKYNTFWGKAINFDDARCDGVRNYYWQNAMLWLEKYHVDGLRLDAVHAIWDFSARHFLAELVTKVNELEESTAKKKVLVAEFDLNNPRYIRPPEKGGYGLTGQWIDEFHHALHALVTGERDGYYEDFGDADHLIRAIRDSYVYTGQYSVHRKKRFGTDAGGIAYSQFVVFSQNHDQVGNRMLGERLSNLVSFEALKLVAATYLLAPQVPMLFMGEEYAEKNPFQYFISHMDKELVEMVRKGRKEEFSYFRWQGEVPDPQSEETFDRCKLSWGAESDNQVMLAYYQHLISFRKTHPAMKGDTQNDVVVYPAENSRVIAFERSFGANAILVVLAFENSNASFTYMGSRSGGKKIFDSSSLRWRGPGEICADVLDVDKPLLLHPHSAIIFELT